jgi:hypothetical protein
LGAWAFRGKNANAHHAWMRRERSAEIEDDKEQSGAEPVKIPDFLIPDPMVPHRAMALF